MNDARTLFLSVAVAIGLSAGTISVSISPPSQQVSNGQTVSASVGISGLGNPPSVGSFDLTVAYDSSLLSFQSVDFGTLLGDPALLEALTATTPLPGLIEFANVSLLSPAALDSIQSSAFTLATLSFTATAGGVASLSIAGGVVDDSFGNKLVGIPEPPTIGLVFVLPALLLVLRSGLCWRARRPLLPVTIALVFAAGGSAQTTTQKTKLNQIGPSDRSAAPPRPPSPNVCVQHIVTVDAKTGNASLKATFTNKDDKAKKFIFCQMIGVSDAQMRKAAQCDIYKDGNTIKCKKSTRSFGSALDTYHFGCKLVSLAGKESKTTDYGTGQSDQFKGKKASDFKVTYADYVQLDGGVGFDEDSCSANMCFGKDANTGLVGTIEIMGDWYLPKLAFDDPFLSYQQVCRAPLPPEYSSYDAPLSAPSNFPVTVPQLPANTTGTVPSAYAVPLNLFDVYTMGADSPATAAAITTLVSPSILQSSFSTNPPPSPSVFTIPGGEMGMGTLTIQRPGSSPEGTSAEVAVVFHLPDSPSAPGPTLFEEKGLFIRDTEPPTITRHLLLFDSSNSLHVDATATDAVTTPLSAEFWYSTDGGVTWTNTPLSTASNLFDDLQHTRVFSGDIGTFLPGTTLSYFITVQDEVMNTNFLGVGQAPAKLSCDINNDGKVDINDIQLILAARGKTVSPGDPRDVDRDCVVSVNDARACVLRCNKTNCAP